MVYEKYPFLRAQESAEVVPVVTVHDGDTVTVIIDKKNRKVRLVGIDAPEIMQKPWGENAKQYLESLINSSGRKVRMEFDLEKIDQYGRILAYLWTIDGKLINTVMLKEGYAVLYTIPPNVKYAGEFRSAQKTARDRGLGVWSAQGLEQRPSDYRKENPRTDSQIAR